MDEPRIAIRIVGGKYAAIGPADRILPISGGPIALDGGKYAGETVWLKRAVAQEFDHPEYGRIVAVWVDTTRLAEAPKLAAAHAALRAKLTMAALNYVDTTIPSCHNCGNCKECC